MKLNIIIEKLNELYPESLKSSYDNVGLMVGSMTKDVKRVLLALDLTREVMDEAINNNIDLIITHHPVLFHPLSMIDTDKDPGSIIRDLIKYDIANYAMHTNFDVVKMNDYLSSLIGIENKEILSESESLGVYGDIKPTKVEDYILKVKKAFGIASCEYYGKENITISKVGIIGGSGSSRIDAAKEKGLDLFITGDVSYSRGIEAKRLGVNVLDVGHFVEHLFTDVLNEDLKNLDSTLEVLTSSVDVIPYVRY
ncbi:Nif3-like dinuclear metal center hexameric protein [bacterium]|nr:Nif3-like dinuclear metal center hexameric protein [bacterium]